MQSSKINSVLNRGILDFHVDLEVTAQTVVALSGTNYQI